MLKYTRKGDYFHRFLDFFYFTIKNFSIKRRFQDPTDTVHCSAFFLLPVLSDFFVFVPNHSSRLITLINYVCVLDRDVKYIIELSISFSFVTGSDVSGTIPFQGNLTLDLVFIVVSIFWSKTHEKYLVKSKFSSKSWLSRH